MITQLPAINDQIRGLTTRMSRFFADLAGANGPATTAAARVLMRAIRRKLSVRAAVTRRTFGGEQSRTEASSPGEPPRRRTGRLIKSVGTEVVGGVRRVGLARFVARLLEEGVDTTVTVTPSGRVFNARRRKAKTARRRLQIAPRPFMQAALDSALPRMGDEAVTSLQARERTLAVFP